MSAYLFMTTCRVNSDSRVLVPWGRKFGLWPPKKATAKCISPVKVPKASYSCPDQRYNIYSVQTIEFYSGEDGSKPSSHGPAPSNLRESPWTTWWRTTRLVGMVSCEKVSFTTVLSMHILWKVNDYPEYESSGLDNRGCQSYQWTITFIMLDNRGSCNSLWNCWR